MAVLLRKLAGPRSSSRWWLGAILRKTHVPATYLKTCDGARLTPGAGRPMAACSRAHSRAQHTEAAGPAEVDLKRLEGGDDGKDSLKWCDSTLSLSLTNNAFRKLVTYLFAPGPSPVQTHSVMTHMV